jgi:hypothetical protein
MNAAQSCQSRYRDKNAATSAAARAGAPGAWGHSPGVHTHIDAGRAFLAISLGSRTNAQLRSSGACRPVRRRTGATLASDARSQNQPATLRLEVAFWR